MVFLTVFISLKSYKRSFLIELDLLVSSLTISLEAAMLNSNFKNGKNLDLQSAFAFFVVMMALLFHIDAVAGLHSVISLSTLFIGLAWFFGRQYYCHHHHLS